MEFTLEFYNDSVQDEVFSWPDGIQASFTRIAEQMTEHGPNLGMPYTRPSGDGLFEIRAKELRVARQRLKEVQNG